MAGQKKLPERMCLGCQQLHIKRELIRIVRSPEGEFSIDLTGKKSGRGAYICNNVECFDKAVKERRFEKSFKSAIDNKIYEELRAGFFKNNE
ncbi:MAG: RNase P modulator RnpM [Selenomonadaceae bacterium]